MSNIILENSMAAYEPLTRYEACPASFIVCPQDEIQSSSVTPIGHLWEQTLACVKNDGLPVTSYQALSRTNVSHTIKHMQKHIALIQLLEAWREEDEQESDDTWEQLKQALDEDRLSDRKLFP